MGDIARHRLNVHAFGVVQQADFDVTFEQCVLSDGNLAGATLIRHTRLSDGEIKICLFP